MIDGHALVAETNRINLYSEYSLHDQLKRLAAGSGGRIEVVIEGKIADALRPDGEIVEIQTGTLSSLVDKARFWSLRGYKQRIQVPLAVQKRGTLVGLRSPGKGVGSSVLAGAGHGACLHRNGRDPCRAGRAGPPGPISQILRYDRSKPDRREGIEGVFEPRGLVVLIAGE